MLNIAYPTPPPPPKKNGIGRPYSSRNHVIVVHALNFTFNLDIESTDKTRSIANNVGEH